MCIAVVCLLATAGPARADRPGPQHAFPVTRTGDASLPDHTILQPANLDAVGFKLPIVVWGNGGCRDSNEEFHYFLTHLAAMGFFVVANGKPENPYHPEELAGLTDPQPEKLIAGIDWAVKRDGVDPSRVVVMGQSCGGWETMDASGDPRVTTSVIWNSGADPYDPATVTALHAPLLYAYGGATDYANWDPVASYQATSVPAVLASHADARHTGMFDDPSDGSPPPGPYQDEPLVLAANWLAFTLYGAPEGRSFFLGDGCGLCTRPSWTVESKNWEAY